MTSFALQVKRCLKTGIPCWRIPQLHGRGISYDEERNTYTVTTRAYDKLKEQYRIRYETCLD